MSYILKTSSGTPLLTLTDSTFDNTTTSLTLIGKNLVNYGSSINQNLIDLMQNFASSSSPIKPLPGQLWFDKIAGILKLYSGNNWISLLPPTNGQAGATAITIPGINEQITVFLSDGVIVSAVSHRNISRAILPASIAIDDISYAFGTRFPLGIFTGINLATDPDRAPGDQYKFAGTAYAADRLSNVVVISLKDSVTGSATFTGTNNITISTSLANLGVEGTYYKLTVSSNGLVVGGNVSIDPNDIINSLGYVPISSINISGDVNGFSNITGNVANITTTMREIGAAGTYNLVDVASNGIVTGGSYTDVTTQLGYQPIGNISLTGDATGTSNVIGNTAYVTVALANIHVGGTYNIVQVSNTGIVTSGESFGYTPLGEVIISGAVNGISIVSDNVATIDTTLSNLRVAGTYNTVTVADTGLVTDGSMAEVTNSLLAPMTASTVKANITSGLASPQDIDIATFFNSYSAGAWTEVFSHDGWAKAPNGLIWQWAEVSVTSGGSTSITFVPSFPTACVFATCTNIDEGGGSGTQNNPAQFDPASITNSGGTIKNAGNGTSAMIFAVGF